MKRGEERTDLLEGLVGQMLTTLGYDTTNQHFKGTPGRFIRYLLEFTRTEDETSAAVLDILDTSFACPNDEMIVCSHIRAVSICPHHLLPVFYDAHVGYIPNRFVLGLSKPVRLVRVLAQRPIIQEDLAVEIADALDQGLSPRGVMVVLDGVHMCMRARGVREQSSVVRSSCVRGVFADRTDTAKAEFLSLINHRREC